MMLRPKNQLPKPGFSSGCKKYGKTATTISVKARNTVSNAKVPIVCPNSTARKNKTNVVSIEKLLSPREFSMPALVFISSVQSSLSKFVKSQPQTAICRPPVFLYFSPGLLNCWYATRNNSDNAFAVSGDRFLSARRCASTISGVASCG